MIAYATAPYVRATYAPPEGLAFAGFFWYVDDGYNYLSYVQQAEEGAVLFRNKLVVEPHAGALINPEWWLVGVLSRALGREPHLAYRLFAIAAIVGLVTGIHRWLVDVGVPRTHALAALLLVCLGGGAGAACVWAGRLPAGCLDLGAGLFPVIEMIANPHFVAGTALLLWALRAFRLHAESGGTKALAAAAGLATILGLTRPYDLVLLCCIRGLVVAFTEPPRRWPEHAAAMATLLPVVAYLGWVFYFVPAFASLAEIRYAFPPLADFAWALGPGMAVAGLAWLRGRPPLDPPARRAVAHLLAWLAAGALMILFHPVNFALQFVVGVGVPLLALAALGLAAFPPAATYAAVFVLSTTAIFAVHVTDAASPSWFVPRERLEIAERLRGPCRPGDVLLSPADIGLYAGGLTACTPYVSHEGAPGFEERAGRIRRFYEAADPAAGRALVDLTCAAHVVVPAGRPIDAFVAPAAGFEPSAVAGAPGRALAVYSRATPPACVPSR
jgi:hypothetical protein